MKYTPTAKITYWTSLAITAIAVFSLCLGWFIYSAILGCAAAINLLVAVAKKKY